ncbi:DNA cytosine methyltransferase [Clostridium estertheticum]|uniref:DNA cytosine methyltransferase n=1 Tax=Clostridium estertheticum TaxID=238834 RepID=UPI001C0E24FA|nr:DNA cytosine methyltransferase [Clostridium estertheticum]MBU3201736.1 DNA cytosine methyltransferase [Clostridium estertheticum]WAG67134.1 DNA cytosine methyltransferase [Clostridium estertheticum]
MEIFKKGELFCGPGGLAFGAQNVSFTDKTGKEYKVEHAWANDIDLAACRTFAHNICGVDEENVDECICNSEDQLDIANGKSVLCKDVKQIDITKLPPIDAFTFGFPCNDFSIVGEQKGFEGTYGPLYTYGIKVLNTHNPKWFLAENVGGLMSANGGEAFKQIIRDLASSGNYGGYVLTPHLYKFEQYGVPQMRHRIIIVGIRKDIVKKQGIEFRIPAPTTPTKKEYKTSRWALEVGKEKIAITQDGNFYNNETTSHSNAVIERLGYIQPGGNAWDETIPQRLRLNVKGARLSNIYKRLHPDRPAYTVTGSGGGGTHMYHYAENRALTSRERARLQSFPDNYKFLGSKEEVRKQIGMAVPVEGARIIIEAILKTFAHQNYDYVEPKWNIEDLRDTK